MNNFEHGLVKYIDHERLEKLQNKGWDCRSWGTWLKLRF